MKYYFFTVIFMATTVVRSAPLDESTAASVTSVSMPESNAAYLPPAIEIITYEYTPTDNGGYKYNLTLSNTVHREETLEIRNKGTPEEETFVNGLYWFKGADGYKYTIKYSIDKNGTHTDIESLYTNRIPPTLLKTLVG